MSRFLPLLLIAVAAGAQVNVDPARVRRVLSQATILDLHDDTTQMILDENYRLAERHEYGQVDIPRMRQGGVTGLFLSLWTDPSGFTPTETIRRTLEQIDAIRREVARNPDKLELAATASQIESARSHGRIAILMGLEGGQAIDSDLAILRIYHDLGVRYMTLTHTRNTPWADSSAEKPAHDGLTDFGRQVVREMNRLGMMVDISHVSDKTFYDVIAASSAPVIASHSSCRALADVPRNMTDDMLRALARNGGVVHINFYEGFLDKGFEQRFNAFKPEHARQNGMDTRTPKFGDRSQSGPASRQMSAERNAKLGRIPLSTLLDHIQHAVEIAGIDHVGLGSDFDGADDAFPQDMEDISKIPNLIRGLMERNFSDADILKILGGNTLRVMREVERAQVTK